jgi:hypothetical protein
LLPPVRPSAAVSIRLTASGRLIVTTVGMDPRFVTKPHSDDQKIRTKDEQNIIKEARHCLNAVTLDPHIR